MLRKLTGRVNSDLSREHWRVIFSPTAAPLVIIRRLMLTGWNKRPKMGLNCSPDNHWCHGQEYGLEDWVRTLNTSVLTSPY